MSEALNRQAEIKALCKSLSDAQDVANKPDLMALLDKLCAVRVDEKLLRATGAGQVVGKLRNNEDSAIAAMAKKVVHKWKKDVMAANSRGVSPASTPRPASRSQTPLPAKSAQDSSRAQSQQPRSTMDNRSSTGPPAGRNGVEQTSPETSSPRTTSTATAASAGAATGTLADSAKPRTAALDKANIALSGDNTRDKCVEILYNSMASDSNADVELLAKRALDIERIEFNKVKGRTIPAYSARIRSLCLNLRDKKNPDLRANVVDGSISVERFCSMTSEEMASKDLRETIEKMKEENLFKAKGAGRTEAATDQFKCGRCKQRKCTYYQMQTRSADEPMTTFVTCTVCDNRWKFC
ncbi:transcription elongation factor TFIIS [Coemansia guatemalensis]|uniref:Transcription elongation factor n=1 Tax=Coemansia guatemalensis TaxID=2761395 RepID=A0A9W8I0R6_9FUNG|nr:transcription elongation factor TFIIS [Coemansia guatemalensis]